MSTAKYDKMKFRLINHYENRLDNNVPNYKILDWESSDAQLSRFSVLLENIDLENKTILDAGCGLADLYSFLTKTNVDMSYSGIDISEKMIDRCKNKFPDITFICDDIFQCDKAFNESSFDIVYSSGVFNLNLGNNFDLLKQAIPSFYKISSKYIIFNLLSHKSTDKDSKYYYYSPSEVISLLKTYKFSKIKIVEDYLSNDFTVICEK